VRVICAADCFADYVGRGFTLGLSVGDTEDPSGGQYVQYKQSPTVLLADTPCRSRRLTHSSVEPAADGRVPRNSFSVRVEEPYG
jgi:hypothetical protein